MVKVIISDVNIWGNSNETVQKEFMNNLGKDINYFISNAANTKGDLVGGNIRLYSTSGLELAEYNAFGNVKLK